jgi:hypothetical protein
MPPALLDILGIDNITVALATSAPPAAAFS